MKVYKSAPSRCISSSIVAHSHCRAFHSHDHSAQRKSLTLRNPTLNFRKDFINTSQTRKSSSRVHRTRPSAHYDPFDANDYHLANLQLLQGHDQMMTGIMLFQKENEDDDMGMVVAIGGDTFHAIVLLLQGRLEIRPLTVDLLCRVLDQARSVSKTDWTIVRVAITGLAESTFIGRIFFGNRDSDEIIWDLDCRPSDGVFLALKYGAPIYIHEKVWDTVAAPLDELKENAQWQMSHVNKELRAHREGDEYEEVHMSGKPGDQQSSRKKIDVAAFMTTVRRSDPEPLKLLKMELKVAIAEEDYAAAARIRDHVFMKLSVASAVAKEEGDHEAAANYEKTLRGYITSMEEGSMSYHSGSDE